MDQSLRRIERVSMKRLQKAPVKTANEILENRSDQRSGICRENGISPRSILPAWPVSHR